MDVLAQAYRLSALEPPVVAWSDAFHHPAALHGACRYCCRPFQRSAFTPSSRAVVVVAVTYRHSPFRLHDEVRLYHPGCYQEMRAGGFHCCKPTPKLGQPRAWMRRIADAMAMKGACGGR